MTWPVKLGPLADGDFDELAARWSPPPKPDPLPLRPPVAKVPTCASGLSLDAELFYYRHVTQEARRRGIPERNLAYALALEQAITESGWAASAEVAA